MYNVKYVYAKIEAATSKMNGVISTLEKPHIHVLGKLPPFKVFLLKSCWT